jgi:hypothetical protein
MSTDTSPSRGTEIDIPSSVMDSAVGGKMQRKYSTTREVFGSSRSFCALSVHLPTILSISLSLSLSLSLSAASSYTVIKYIP